MRFVAVSLALLVAACGSAVTEPPTTVPASVTVEPEVPTTAIVPCVDLAVFQSDASFGPPNRLEAGSTWDTEWATIDVRAEAPSGEEVDRWALHAIDGEALVRVTDGGLAALVDLGAGPCSRFGVWSTGEIADAVSDALLGFLEGLKPIDQLAEHLAALEAADRSPACPAGTVAPVTPRTVHVMLLCAGTLPVYPVIRDVPEGADPIAVALIGLVDGPTDEERKSGLVGTFDGIDPKPDIGYEVTGGELVIGFELDGEPWGPGPAVSSSSQIMTFIDALFATAFQFDEVDAVTLDTCISEMGCAPRSSRSEFEQMQVANWGVDFGEDCGLVGYWSDPSCTTPTE